MKRKNILIVGFRLFVALIAWLFVTSVAMADYSSDFDSLNGSASGTVLTGQDSYYLPSGVDYFVYTYTGNTLSLPQNPNGGSQFVGGTSTLGGQWPYARAQRDVDFSAARIWTISYDFAGKYLGIAQSTENNLGSFSTQPTANAYYNQLMSWVDVTNPGAGFNAFYVAFDAFGNEFAQPGESPGSAWENLNANYWYHASTTFDLTTNQITEVGIVDLTTNVSATYFPTGWYLFGGSAGASDPTAFRFFAGGANGGNMLAFDNISNQPVPEPATLLLIGSGLMGLAGLRRKFKK